MADDLKSMSRKELEKLRKQIEAQLAKLDAGEKKKALAAAKKAAASFGYDLKDVIGGASAPKPDKAAAKPKKASPPKYAHPENPAVTWTGKGRQPAWFKEAMEAGKSPEDLAI